MKRTTAILLVLGALCIGISAWWMLRGRPVARPELHAETAVTLPHEAEEPTNVDRPETAVATRSAIEPKSAASPAQSAVTQSKHRLHGRVIDDVGQPVAGFDIQFRSGHSAPEHDWSAHDAIMGDAPLHHFEHPNGEFDLDVEAGQWLVRALRTSGQKSSTVDVTFPLPPESALVIVLPRSSKISGVVQATNGLPIEGAGIHARAAGARLPKLQGERAPPPTVVTDAAGRFELGDASTGSLSIAATHADYADSEWLKISTTAGGGEHLTITLLSGGRITGNVDASRAPVADRHVGLASFRGQVGWRETRTDASGRFVIEHVMPQQYVIGLQAAGNAGPRESIRKNIEVKEGETTEVVLGATLRDIHLRGVVTCADKPIAGIVVHAYSHEDGEDRGDEPVSGTDGRFEMVLDGAGSYEFHLRGESNSYVRFERTLARDDTDIRFELPGGSLRGVVVSSTGEPISRAPVTILREVPNPSSDPLEFWSRYSRTYTDAEGRFEFTFLHVGNYTLRAPDGHLRDFPPPRTPHGGVVLAGILIEAQALDVGQVRLKEEGHILGTVVDAAGSPVAGAGIQAADASGKDRFGMTEISTDSTGSFTIDSLAPGTYSVRARKGDNKATSAPVVVEAEKTATVRIQLP